MDSYNQSPHFYQPPYPPHQGYGYGPQQGTGYGPIQPPPYGPPPGQGYGPQQGTGYGPIQPPPYGPPQGGVPPIGVPPQYGPGPSAVRIGPQLEYHSGPGQIPDTAHMHPLFQEPSHYGCKVCRKMIGGGQAYVCRTCELVLCYECFNRIYYGTKHEEVHPHPLMLRVRPSWICDLCHRRYQDVASFYCKVCDFDACSMCYVGYWEIWY